MTVMPAVPPHPKPLCAIPVYNNAATLPDVVRRAVAQGVAVLVVDDGSTDADATELLRGLPATVPNGQSPGRRWRMLATSSSRLPASCVWTRQLCRRSLSLSGSRLACCARTTSIVASDGSVPSA